MNSGNGVIKIWYCTHSLSCLARFSYYHIYIRKEKEWKVDHDVRVMLAREMRICELYKTIS